MGAEPFILAREGAEFCFDFNPTVDRIRVVRITRQDLRPDPDPDTGASSTTLYAVDADTRVPQNVVGVLRIDMSELAGFDILPTTWLLGVLDRADQASGIVLPT
jgi:Domain of unknown function (DUF4394)